MTERDGSLRVLLVDDQQLILRGLAMLLATVEGIEVVAQADDGRAALRELATTAVDVVVTDARMPVMDGIELAVHLRRHRPELPVLVLTTFDDDDLVRRVLDAGAAGFLVKDTSVERLADALRAVADGGLVVDPRMARAALRPSSEAESDSALAVLTRAERAVAELVASGRTNTEIAAALVLAEGTVKNHVSALLRKLGARDRTALALTLHEAFRGRTT